MAEAIATPKLKNNPLARKDTLRMKSPRIKRMPQNHSIHGRVTARYLMTNAELKM